jgi:hypothetical protein
MKLTTSSSGVTAGYRGDDGELVVLGDFGIRPVEVADILLALVHVDERAELAVAGVEVLPEVRVLLGEVPERLPGGGTSYLDLRVTGRVLPQGRRDLDLRHL